MARSDIGGVQIVDNWRSLEPEKNKYNFSQIEKDLARLKVGSKKLFIQIQYRFFEQDARYVPGYLMNDAGGISPQLDNPGEGKHPSEVIHHKTKYNLDKTALSHELRFRQKERDSIW
ncbi:hypothetical protein M5U04_20595 [Xenorhabdus sp. XENO-1]|uniref:hypothetical protein n=1 Tax=Xenorhabdus bovienii TaxID=40576 RepID=UPI0020CA7E64|nr:hypothetical protein [Xenorhabdus bovienii]MCP9270406.1 hypothetical protein [Xenorhabdus bovienii subsp. africana]